MKAKYKKLPKSLRKVKHGYDFTLIKRKGDIAWYEARYLNGNELQGYVVAKIRKRNEHTYPNGIVEEAHEYFPAPSAFGQDAWFYMAKSKSIAEEHFMSLSRKNRR